MYKMKRGELMHIRERQGLQTRQKLIRTAEQLFGKEGFDNVSVDQIVAQCGIAKGTFYHHFKSKEELMLQLCSSFYEGLGEQIEAMNCSTGLEKLQNFILLWYQKVGAFNLQFSRQSEDRRPSQLEQGIVLIRQYLLEAAEHQELCPDTPVDTLSKALMFAMQGSAVFHNQKSQEFDIPAWSQEFRTHVLMPLLAPHLPQHK